MLQAVSRCFARALAASLLAGIVSATALGVDNPLDAVPEDAVAVVRFKKPAATIDNAVKMAATVDRAKAPKLKQQSNGIGAMIHNPSGAGVDAKYDWYVVYIVPPAANAQPNAETAASPIPGYPSGGSLLAGAAAVYAMPAAKMDAMEAAVTQSLPNAKTVKHENWLFYSDSDAAIARITDCKSGRVKPIRDTIDAQSKGVIEGSDLSLYVNVRSLTRGRYKTELEAVRIELEEALKNPASFAPVDVKGVDLKPLYDAYSGLLHGAWQALNDCEAVTIGATIKTARGIEMELYARVETGSPTADALKSTSTSSMALLDKLPPGNLAYFGSHGGFESLGRWSMTMARTLTQDESVRKLLDEAIADYGQIEYGTTATAITLGDAQHGAVRTITLSEMKPAEKARDLTRKTIGAVTAATLGQLNQTVDLKTEAETIAGHPVDLLTVKPGDGAGRFEAELLKTVGGAEGATKRIVYLPEMVVTTEGGGPEAMEAALAGLGIGRKPASSTDPAAARNTLIAPVRSQLSPSANFVMLVDVGGVAADGVKSFMGQLGGLIDGDQAKKLSVKRSYLGLSAAAEPTGARIKVHVPIAQIQSLTKLADFFAPFVPLLTPGGGRSGTL